MNEKRRKRKGGDCVKRLRVVKTLPLTHAYSPVFEVNWLKQFALDHSATPAG
jgi:hypothetical protein